ncbi:MAG TPA: peptide transporter [Armatimonadota bacterium]|nr:peptide transporter [Armatimonadota bacterium]
MEQTIQTKPNLQRTPKVDGELEVFRSLMEVPSTFEEGFSWKSLIGALFIALLMVPGAIYMDLMAGQGIGPAAQWVTVILFVEVARRAQSNLKRPEIFVLFYMAGAAVGMPFFGLLWNQFFIHSQAAQATGIASQLPAWFAPRLDSLSYAHRSFFNVDWLPVIGIIAFQAIFSNLSNMMLGYGLFRLTSDVEKLPFPMAPVGAQGIMALAEDVGERASAKKEDSWRWRVFSIGGALGLAFGAIYLLLPLITGALTGNPIQLFTIPFLDATSKTQNFLPAVATGLSWDATNLITGMVLPFTAMVGSFIGLIFTMIANPILYHHNVLTSWVPGDDTIATLFKNNIDFYLSFGIGISLSIAIVGIYQIVKGLRARRKSLDVTVSTPSFGSRHKERGDIRYQWILGCYFIITLSYILLSGYLIHWHRGVMIVLVFFGFVYTPLISYVTARLEGMAGQVVEIPMIKEISLIMSGFHGVQVWFLPIPMSNYGQMTVTYRQCELTGTKFTGIWKTQLILFPIILISSFCFMNFIWGLGDVPSQVYPFAQKMWELNAANQSIIYTSTMGDYSIFEDAFKPIYIGIGAGVGVVLFSILSAIGAPIFMMYGIVRGVGNAMPHYLIPQMIGALLGRYYFQRRMGLQWRQFVPVVAAGFACGMGLIMTLGIGVTFMSKAIIQSPF